MCNLLVLLQGALSDQHKDDKGKHHQQAAKCKSGCETTPTIAITDLPEALREVLILF